MIIGKNFFINEMPKTGTSFLRNYFKNYNGIFVKTLKRDTQNISFYEKNNFNIIDEVFGRVYLKFVN